MPYESERSSQWTDWWSIHAISMVTSTQFETAWCGIRFSPKFAISAHLPRAEHARCLDGAGPAVGRRRLIARRPAARRGATAVPNTRRARLAGKRMGERDGGGSIGP